MASLVQRIQKLEPERIVGEVAGLCLTTASAPSLMSVLARCTAFLLGWRAQGFEKHASVADEERGRRANSLGSWDRSFICTDKTGKSEGFPSRVVTTDI